MDFSLDSSQLPGRSHYEIFPDIPDRWKQIHRRALAGESLRAEEDRWDRENGTTWLRWEIRLWQNPGGLQGGILIFSEDITYRKQAEEALLGMSRKLIEAQERERTRIGRELHDDIGQRLALAASSYSNSTMTLSSCPTSAAAWANSRADFGDSRRYSIPVTRVAFGKTAILGYCRLHERLLPRIRRAAESGD